jgi:hypothetical protein
MNRPSGPDFICIGMQKAGTDWLYDQLQFHPDFWMPPIKEFHYFDRRKMPKIGNARRVLEMEPARMEKRLSRRRAWDERDHEFLREADLCNGPLNIPRYAALFRHKGELLSGDITPGYSVLDDDTVTRIGAELPQTKIVLLVREPIARAWSQISMAYRNDNFDASVLDDPISFAHFLGTSTLVGDRSFPTRIVERWSRCASHVEFGYFLFDEIATNADNARKAILHFLGADPTKSSGELRSDHNRKSNLPKLPLTEQNRAILVQHFKDELLSCAALFGGPAQTWPSRYGI